MATIFHHTLFITIGTFFSKLLGLIRDASIAWLLGNTATADALTIALRVPFLFRRMLSDGALSMGLTSTCCQAALYHNNGIRLILRISWILALFTSILVLIVLIMPNIALDILALGFNWKNTVNDEVVQLFSICLPYSIFAILTAGNIAVLHSKNFFLLPILSPILFNSVVLFFAFFSIGHNIKTIGILLAYSVLCGGIFQWLLQVPISLRLKNNEPKEKQHLSTLTKALSKIPINIFTAALPQLIFIIASILTSFLSTGHVSSLFYAERLIEFPLGVLGNAIGIITLPMLATMYKQNQQVQMATSLTKNVTLVCGMNIPASLGLMAISTPLVQIIFHHGIFDPQATKMTSLALCAYAPGLPAIALARTLLASSYAINNHKMPFIAAIIALILTFLLGSLLLYLFETIGPPLGASLGLWSYCWLLWKGLKTYIPIQFPIQSICMQLLAALGTFTTSSIVILCYKNTTSTTIISFAILVGTITYGFSLFLFDKDQLIQLWKSIRHVKLN